MVKMRLLVHGCATEPVPLVYIRSKCNSDLSAIFSLAERGLLVVTKSELTHKNMSCVFSEWTKI